MLTVARPSDMSAYAGQHIGTSDWITVEQSLIELFADATDDHNWIHVDVERAKREMPDGVTIAHGYLTLSLLPRLARSIFRILSYSQSLNYGANRIRFTGRVPAGARIRLQLTLRNIHSVDGAERLTFENIVEVESQTKPALIAETIVQYYE